MHIIYIILISLIISISTINASTNTDTIIKLLQKQHFDSGRNDILDIMMADINEVNSLEISIMLSVYAFDNERYIALSKMDKFISMYNINDISKILQTFSFDDIKFTTFRRIISIIQYDKCISISYGDLTSILNTFNFDTEKIKVIDLIFDQIDKNSYDEKYYDVIPNDRKEKLNIPFHNKNYQNDNNDNDYDAHIKYSNVIRVGYTVVNCPKHIYAYQIINNNKVFADDTAGYIQTKDNMCIKFQSVLKIDGMMYSYDDGCIILNGKDHITGTTWGETTICQ